MKKGSGDLPPPLPPLVTRLYISLFISQLCHVTTNRMEEAATGVVL